MLAGNSTSVLFHLVAWAVHMAIANRPVVSPSRGLLQKEVIVVRKKVLSEFLRDADIPIAKHVLPHTSKEVLAAELVVLFAPSRKSQVDDPRPKADLSGRGEGELCRDEVARDWVHDVLDHALLVAQRPDADVACPYSYNVDFPSNVSVQIRLLFRPEQVVRVPECYLRRGQSIVLAERKWGPVNDHNCNLLPELAWP